MESRVLLSAAPGASVDYNVVNDWGSGFQAKVLVTNHQDTPIRNWQVVFDLDGQITDIWNADVVSQNGDDYIVEHKNYNQVINPGQQISFGFIVNNAADTNADDLVLIADGLDAQPGPDPDPTPDPDPAPDPDPTPDPDPDPPANDDYIDLMSWGMFHSASDHTGDDGLVGGRTAITTEALVAYNGLRAFLGLSAATVEDVGTWAFDNQLTNNSQAWENDLQGVGLWYAMQGAKVGWMSDAAFDPQVVADVERTARLGDPADVMAIVEQYDHEGFAEYIQQNGLTDPFINTLKMEPHYAGWMHSRTHGYLSIEGVAIAHDVNHLTVLSHDQMQPFMNDTWDYPQWPALDVSDSGVIEYFQSMVVFGDPVGLNMEFLDEPSPNPDPGPAPDPDPDPTPDPDPDPTPDPDPVPTPGDDPDAGFSFNIINDWGGGFTAGFAVSNDSTQAFGSWTVEFTAPFNITNIWNAKIVERSGDRYVISNESWNAGVAAGVEVSFGFQADPGGASATISDVAINGQTITDQTPAPTPGPDPQPAEPPRVSVGDVAVEEGDVTYIADGYLTTQGNQIVDADGNNVRIAAAAWFGFESETMVAHGLWTRNWQEMMDEMQAAGFNTIRMPFSTESMQPGVMPSSINYAQNPDLRGLTSIEVLDKIVEYADQIGMRIMLDHHRSEAGIGALGEDLWYTDRFGEQAWIDTWVNLATRYLDNPSVIAMDLHNEPHGRATWGSGDLATDWRLAAERSGNAILAVNPSLLIVVEGVESYEGDSYWWGGNLQGVRDYPVRLDQPSQLVYSPHAYPASIYNQPWFSDPGYPDNLPEVWSENWGYIYEEGIAPVLLGEFGSNLHTETDRLWMQKMIDYIAGDLDGDGDNDLAAGEYGISYSFWSWNPNSGDTGGILLDDWRTLNQEKLDLLRPVQFQFPVTSGGQQAALPEITYAFVTVQLSEAHSEAVTVSYRTVADTATAGEDYTPVSGTLTFEAGQTTAVVQIPILGDLLAEPVETFTLELYDVNGGVLDDAVGVVSVMADDTE